MEVESESESWKPSYLTEAIGNGTVQFCNCQVVVCRRFLVSRMDLNSGDHKDALRRIMYGSEVSHAEQNVYPGRLRNAQLGTSRLIYFCELSIQDSCNNRDFNSIINSWIDSFSKRILQFMWIVDSWFTWKFGFWINSRFIESWILTSLCTTHNCYFLVKIWILQFAI